MTGCKGGAVAGRAFAPAGRVAPNRYLDEARAVDLNIERYGSKDSWRFSPRFDLATRILSAREMLAKQYAWAIPNDAALDALAALGPIVEIGAGTGYWAHLLASRGVDIVAYDIAPGKNAWCDVERCYHPVSVGGLEKVADHPDRALFLCWPPMSPMAADALRAYCGSAVAYVGEHGGCTADDDFHAQLAGGWIEQADVMIPQWYGVHDALFIYQR